MLCALLDVSGMYLWGHRRSLGSVSALDMCREVRCPTNINIILAINHYNTGITSISPQGVAIIP